MNISYLSGCTNPGVIPLDCATSTSSSLLNDLSILDREQKTTLSNFEAKKITFLKEEREEKAEKAEDFLFKFPLEISTYILSFVKEPSNISKVCSVWKEVSLKYCFSFVISEYEEIVGEQYASILYQKASVKEKAEKTIELSDHQKVALLVQEQQSRLKLLLGKNLAMSFLESLQSLPEIERFKQIEIFIQDYNLLVMYNNIIDPQNIFDDFQVESERIISRVKKDKNFSIQQQAEQIRNGLSNGTLGQGATQLVLKEAGLTSLPPEIGYLTNLVRLDLSKNHIKVLPDQITQLKQLNYLTLSDNQLQCFPNQLNQLSCLQGLDLDCNQLKDLSSMDGLTFNPISLSFSDNQIESFPTVICQLTNLQRLNLNRNRIKNIPGEINQLINLQDLCLAGNSLKELPDTFWQLNGLQILCVKDNPLPPITQDKIRLFLNNPVHLDI